MNFAELMRESRRLNILQCLRAAPGNSVNSQVLYSALNGAGIPLSRDQVKADMAWLADMHLVRLETLDHGGVALIVATLTPEGDDVAKGCAHVPGIKRALAGESPWQA